MTVLISFLAAFLFGSFAQAGGPTDAIEFVDYIFDRYAHLGLDQDASPHDITQAIKIRRSQNHPDRLTHLSEDLQAKAKANWERVEDCERVLLNEKSRPLFDRQLNLFREQKPRLISKDGHPIVSLDRDHIDISFLTGDRTADLSPIFKQAELISGFNADQFERAKRMYQRDPLDPDFIELYRDQLEKNAIYLTVSETFLWASAGVYGDKFTEPDAKIWDAQLLGETIKDHVEHIKLRVLPASIQQRSEMLALTHEGHPTLLLEYLSQGERTPGGSLPEVAAKVELAQNRFEQLSKGITVNADERGRVTEELLNLSPFEILHAADKNDIEIFLCQNGEGIYSLDSAEVVASFRLINGTLFTSVEDQGKFFNDIKTRAHRTTTAAVLINRALGQITLDFGHALKRVMQAFGEDLEIVAKKGPRRE